MRDRRQQPPRIVGLRRAEQRRASPHLHHLALLQHDGALAQQPHHVQVVADEEGEAERPPAAAARADAGSRPAPRRRAPRSARRGSAVAAAARWRGRCRRGPSARRKAGAGSGPAIPPAGRTRSAHSSTRAAQSVARACPSMPAQRVAMLSKALKRGLRLSCGSWKTIWMSRRSRDAVEVARRERADRCASRRG